MFPIIESNHRCWSSRILWLTLAFHCRLKETLRERVSKLRNFLSLENEKDPEPLLSNSHDAESHPRINRFLIRKFLKQPVGLWVTEVSAHCDKIQVLCRFRFSNVWLRFGFQCSFSVHNEVTRKSALRLLRQSLVSTPGMPTESSGTCNLTNFVCY